jgi:hypothetical protein
VLVGPASGADGGTAWSVGGAAASAPAAVLGPSAAAAIAGPAITDRQNAVPAVREVAQVLERPDLLTGGSTLT